MQIPQKIPSLKLVFVLLAVYTAVWISLEGALWQVVVMGAGYTAVSLGYGWQKWLGGRVVDGWRWWGVTAVTGLLFGLGSGLLTLVFMAVKTGLHAHGPEFTPAQINWTLRQTPIWAAASLLAALGLALIFKGRKQKAEGRKM
ncbi:MAG: hypothetical protein H6667_25640 [Ardenticatenaceae bacterium]|nr:hypothetical protein [Ardenticatenaceae bacterium]